MPMILTMPLPTEPMAVKQVYFDSESKVRRASLRQASDIVTPLYHDWKDQLKKGDVSWQRFQAAASNNASAWERWLDGSSSWRTAVEEFLHRINTDSDGFEFRLSAV
ncbi:MAG TPA: hypothetical protein VNG12_03720 [Acidimicrobiales bacterium]|nr:hypothetical protein [Acidimicrobiales bacterium]